MVCRECRLLLQGFRPNSGAVKDCDADGGVSDEDALRGCDVFGFSLEGVLGYVVGYAERFDGVGVLERCDVFWKGEIDYENVFNEWFNDFYCRKL